MLSDVIEQFRCWCLLHADVGEIPLGYIPLENKRRLTSSVKCLFFFVDFPHDSFGISRNNAYLCNSIKIIKPIVRCVFEVIRFSRDSFWLESLFLPEKTWAIHAILGISSPCRSRRMVVFWSCFDCKYKQKSAYMLIFYQKKCYFFSLRKHKNKAKCVFRANNVWKSWYCVQNPWNQKF